LQKHEQTVFWHFLAAPSALPPPQKKKKKNNDFRCLDVQLQLARNSTHIQRENIANWNQKHKTEQQNTILLKAPHLSNNTFMKSKPHHKKKKKNKQTNLTHFDVQLQLARNSPHTFNEKRLQIGSRKIKPQQTKHNPL
jgi:hypothetical protein